MFLEKLRARIKIKSLPDLEAEVIRAN